MQTIILLTSILIGASIGVSILTFILLVIDAPHGHEDNAGFHIDDDPPQ